MKFRALCHMSFVLVLAVVLVACGGGSDNAARDAGSGGAATGAAGGDVSAKQWDEPPPMTIDPAKSYTATIATTKGDIVVQLMPKRAPVAVNNFVFLANEGFYDGVSFHRVIENFMIQTGDPTGTGTGGPGYEIEDEKVVDKYERGTVAMARTPAPNSAGSQFFIVHTDEGAKHLEPTYVIFGKVTSGLDVVDAIATTPVEDDGQGNRSKPVEPITIRNVTIKQA